DHVLGRLQPDELSRYDGRRGDHVSPGSLIPAARARSAGTGSACGRATSITAPYPASPTSESTSSCSPSASAKALCACGPPNGTSSSGAAAPVRMSPCVTAPIETSATIGLPFELGIASASGFVPANFGPPAGAPSRAGEVAV